MSEESKNLKNSTKMNNIDIINEKLNSAAQVLTDADAEAKARLAEEKRQKADEERKERLRKEEFERSRKEEERRAREILAKKEAELAYAEAYRKKLREERERAALNAAKQKALQKKEDERKRASEEQARERAAMLRRGLEEAERRNAESDTLVGVAATKARENERAVEELESRIAQMQDVPQEYRAESLENEKSFVISEAGLELSAESIVRENAKECPAPENNSQWQELSSEKILSALEEKLRGRADFNAESSEAYSYNSKTTEAEKASKDTKRADDISAEYLFGSTLDMLKRRSDYSADYESRRKNAEQFITRTREIGIPEKEISGYVEPTSNAGAAFDEKEWTAKTRKKLEKEEQKILRKAEKTAKIQRLYSDMLAEEQEGLQKEDIGEETTSVTDSVAAVTANVSAQNESLHSIFESYDEDEAKIAALREEKANLERRMLEMEAANREEISRLSEKETVVRRELLKAEFAAKESAYRQEIDALNARLYEMEKLHIEQKREIENSIAGYENSKQGFIPNASPAGSFRDLDRQYEDEWLIDGYDRYNQSRLDKASSRGERKYFADLGDDEQLLRGYDNRKRYKGEDNSQSDEDYERDYKDLLLINDYERKRENTPSKNDISDGVSELEVLESEMKLAEGEHNERIMRKKDLKKLLNKSAKREEKLIKSERKKRSRYERAKDGAAILFLTECISLERALLESYISDLKYAVAADSKKHKKLYSKRIDTLTDEFNADLEVWRRQTGNDVASLSSSISTDIISGKSVSPLPEVYYSDTDERRKKSKLSRKDIEQMREEQLLLIKEEARRERTNKKRAQTESGIIPERNKPVTKSMMDKDMTVVSERIAYRENRYRFVVAASRFHFGAETGKEKKARRTAFAKLRKIRSSKKEVLRDAKQNNARYLDIAMQDPESAKARFKANRAKMKDLAARMRALLHERDEINERLLSLYSENGKAAKAKRSKTAELRLKETKRAFKRQMGLYKKISSYRIPLKKKQKIFDLMNRKVELCTYLAELKYRISHTKKKAEEYADIKNEIKDTSRQLKYTERDILSLSKRLAKNAARAANPKRQMLWLLLLILLVAAGLVGYFFFKEQLFGLFNMFLGFIKGLFSGK